MVVGFPMIMVSVSPFLKLLSFLLDTKPPDIEGGMEGLRLTGRMQLSRRQLNKRPLVEPGDCSVLSRDR